MGTRWEQMLVTARKRALVLLGEWSPTAGGEERSEVLEITLQKSPGKPGHGEEQRDWAVAKTCVGSRKCLFPMCLLYFEKMRK